MPTNVPPHFYEAEKRYKSATTPQEKIMFLQEMLAIMPHHKGTDKLQADIRTRIAKHTKEMEKKQSTRVFTYDIRKEGVAQILFLGAPNSGKSQLLSVITSAFSPAAAYPFTTTKPVIGMMQYENIQMQLIDLPAINHEFTKKWGKTLAYKAELILAVLDISDNIETVKSSMAQVREVLFGDKKIIIVANKFDLPQSSKNIELLRFYEPSIPIIPVSAQYKTNLDALKSQIYKSLDIIRVYTKAPNKKPELTDPIVLPRGKTLMDAAALLHKEFLENLKFARLWSHPGTNGKFNGQRVERNHMLEDGDIIEFHI